MILAKISDAKQYLGICENLDRALIRLESDLRDIKPGHYDIDNENLYLNCFDYLNLLESETIYEAHDHYGDIHIVVKGEEKVFVSDTLSLKETERSKEADVFFLEGEAEHTIILRPGTFLVVFPRDAHRIKMQINGPCDVRKAVYKFKL